MLSRYTVWLNDVSLESLDTDGIYVSDIAYQAVTMEPETETLMRRDGAYTGLQSVKSTSVTVSFAVRQYGTADRQETVQAVAQWAAAGGWLRTSDRPGQRLRVVCTQLPGVTSAMRWTDNLSVVFTAYDNPYWEHITPTTVTIEDEETGVLVCPGVRPAQVTVKATALQSITEMWVLVGDTKIELTNTGIGKDRWVDIRYTDDHHILEIMRSDGTSLLHKRTADSDDDLIAVPGNNTIACSADISCEFSVRGCWT